MEKRGTYRWLSLLLALVFVLGLVGCAPEGSSSSEPESESSSMTEQDQDMAFARETVQAYKDVIDRYGLNLQFTSDLKVSGKYYYSIAFNFLEPPEEEVVDTDLKFSQGEADHTSYWFTIVFPDDKYYLYKEFAKATVLVLDQSKTLAEAEELANDIMYSFTESGQRYSDVVTLGDYRVHIATNTGTTFQVINMNEIWMELDPEDYPPIDYERIQAEYTYGNIRFSTKGVVKESYRRDSEWAVVIFEAEDGHEYYGMYSFVYNPILLDVGREYLFYGGPMKIALEGWGPILSIVRVEETPQE